MKLRKLLLKSTIGASALLAAAPALAQEFYVGQTLNVAFPFCPRGTMEADGRILPIAQNTALFSLLGVQYGGNGSTTFALPDLRGRTPIGQGQGPGLSNYVQGQAAGTETVTLTIANMPAHTHTGLIRAVAGAPNSDDPTNASLADFPSGQNIYNNNVMPNVNMAPNTVMTTPAGGNQPTSILNPFLTLRYCIVTEGIFPSRP